MSQRATSGGYVQKISESVTHVHNLLGDSWVAQGCYVDNLSTLYDTLVTDNSKILDTDISDSTIVSSTIRESTVMRSDIISSYIEEHCHISKSTVTNTILRSVGSRDSTIYLEDAYKAICDVKITEGRITESGQITSVFPIGTERQTATLYPHKDTSKPTVRIGCWHGALEDLPKEVAHRLETYVLIGNPKEQVDIYAKEYQAFQTYAETYAEMFIND